MKVILSFVLLLFGLPAVSQENANYSCRVNDTVFVRGLVNNLHELKGFRTIVMDSLGIRRELLMGFDTKYLDQISRSDSCAFKLYVVIFSDFIDRGLDLEFDYMLFRKYRLSFMSPDSIAMKSAYDKKSKMDIKHGLFHNFLYFNELYSSYILNKDVTLKDFDFYIGDFLNSSLDPSLLKKILQGDFSHFRVSVFERVDSRYIAKEYN